MFHVKKDTRHIPEIMFASTNSLGDHHVGEYLDAANRRIGFEDNVPTPITYFPFDALDPQPENPDTISIDQAASAFSEVLSWILASQSFEYAGAKAAALSVLLDPTGRYRSLGAVAREANCSRALLSKAILELRDRFGIKQNFRGNLLRSNCRQAQAEALKTGRHCSFHRSDLRKNRNVSTGDDMNPSARSRLKTLDAACLKVEELEKQLETLRNTKPLTQTAPPTKVATVTIPKPAVAPALRPTLQLSDLNRAELLEALDLANGEGDGEMVKTLYAELNRRRN